MNPDISAALQEVEKDMQEEELKKSIIVTYSAISLTEFLKQDIPPIEYLVSDLLQRNGKTMISATANVGKSIFLQNLSLCMAQGKENYLERFTIKQAKVLYLDLEMGNSALFERFKIMCEDSKADNLIVKYMPSMDLMKPERRIELESIIEEHNIEVVILDPLGNAWCGDENNRQSVGELTAYMNELISRFNVSIIVAHHWRKATKDFKQGGGMAAGSYGWGAWVDNHVTMSGESDSITIACDKSRNCAKFSPFRAKLNIEGLWMEYSGDYDIKFTQSTLVTLYEALQQEYGKDVPVAEMAKYAKANNICSRNTINNLIQKDADSGFPVFEMKLDGKKRILTTKELRAEDYEQQEDLFTSQE